MKKVLYYVSKKYNIPVYANENTWNAMPEQQGKILEENQKKFSVNKEFEIKGYFSDDKTKVISNDCNSGTLSYSHGEIVLEIFGEFPNNDVISYDFGRPIDKIYGFDSSGKLLILESYGKPLGTDSTPGFPIRRYKIKNFQKMILLNY